jgi:hypothetical protein
VQTDCPVLLLAGNKQEECGPNRVKVARGAIRMDVGRSFTIAVDISPCNEECGVAAYKRLTWGTLPRGVNISHLTRTTSLVYIVEWKRISQAESHVGGQSAW